MTSESPIQSERSASDTIIHVEGTDVVYNMDRGISRVLDGVDIRVERDEILGVVGESGSGKSMFASAMLDAVPPPGQIQGDITYYPDDGTGPIDLLELDTNELKAYRWEEVSMVFQGAMTSFNPTMTLRGHFEETIRAHEADMTERMQFARELLENVHLDPDRVMKSYPHELSGGMQQRALIALSLVLEPDVLVMDEPTAALDLLMQRSITGLMGELQEIYDLTLVFITHDLPLVAGFADRLAVMYAFDFVELGPADEIIRNAAHPYTRALIKAVPSIGTPVEEMAPIEGESPDPVDTPSGCSYHPRCPLATEICEEEDPLMQPVTDGHGTACFHWESSADAIPYTIDSDVEDGRTGEVLIEGDGTATGTADADSTVISLEDVEVHFEDESFLDSVRDHETEPVKAVDGVSLEIAENDVIALVGESGCGKTTLGKTAVGLQRPSGGTITFRGQDVWTARDATGEIEIPYHDIRSALQIIHQDPGSSLNPNRTIQEILSTPLKRTRRDLGPTKRKNIVTHLLERVGMVPAPDYAKRFPHQLSGGEKQRIALGRALLMRPDLILADEAVSALDVSLRVEMMDLMIELQELFNTSYLFISHDISNARYLTQKAGGRIGIMYLGRIVEIGTPEAIINNPKHPYTKALVWATPELDPEKAKRSRYEEPPVREVDIPDPENPPSGCNFHPRCESIIPPEEMNVSQEDYNAIMNVRQTIESRSLPTSDIWAELASGDADPESIDRESNTRAFVEALRDRELDGTFPAPHDGRIDAAFEHVAVGDWEEAAELLREHYESVCERVDPSLPEEAQPAACHLHTPPEEERIADRNGNAP